MSDTKLTAEESCRQVLKSIADACDRESLARAGGYLFRYVQEETVLRDCGQRGVCRTPPGCARHWEERSRELVRENEVLRSNCDHLSSENASLASQVESMAMRSTSSWTPAARGPCASPDPHRPAGFGRGAFLCPMGGMLRKSDKGCEKILAP